jgi:catechol 2,3-dioxygenase-like lactoylglutathione lyase family enzyme
MTVLSSYDAIHTPAGAATFPVVVRICSACPHEKGADMLEGKDAAATLAVGDLQAARDFYENTLGFTAIQDQPGGIVYKSGNSAVLVYPSEFAGTNQATAASWAVGDDFDAIVEELRSKGVSFEHYDDLPDTTREGDVHVSGGFKAVWFKDPDGNILNLINETM